MNLMKVGGIMPLFLIFMLIAATIFGDTTPNKTHADYVPDAETAEAIARAVLNAQYGPDRVNQQSPLLVDGSNKEFWIVQGRLIDKDSGRTEVGGGMSVWINKNSGCIMNVTDHLK